MKIFIKQIFYSQIKSKIMRTTVILILCNLFALHATVFSQAKVTMSGENVPLKSALVQIEKEAQVKFVYRDETISDFNVSFDLKNSTIEETLNVVLKGTGSTYRFLGNNLIVISPVELLQGISVSGKVTDETGLGMPGVTVQVKGTMSGTATNIDGSYNINVAGKDAILIFSFIGYTTREIEVGDQTMINVQLSEDTQEIEEVVVVGYGTMQKRDVTGSVVQVQASTLQNIPAARIDQALTGPMAGVQVISATGQPGEAPIFRIRGVGSISAGIGPLYVVDGFPEANIQMLNPNDIESIDVLKDASATAIYGSRGANGVVLITTKRGQEGKSTINFDAYFGWQQVLRKPEFLTMQEQAQYYYDGVVNQNLDSPTYNMSNANPYFWSPNPVPLTVLRVLNHPDRDKNFPVGQTLPNLSHITESHDAYDYIFQNAPQQNYSISARGGTNNLRYSVSGSYMSQEGVIIMSDFQRYTIRANVDAQVNNRVSMKFNISSSYSTSLNIRAYGGTGDAEGILGAATTWQYWYPLYNEDGGYYSGYGQDATNNCWNPLAQANEIKRKNEQYRTLGNLVTNIKITNDLNLNVMLGATSSNSHSYYFIPRLPVFDVGTAEGNDSRSNSLNWLSETTLTYFKKINAHSINAMAGYTTQKNASNDNSVRSRAYPNNMVYTLNAVSNNVDQGSSEESQWSIISYLARINYNYNLKYYLTASIRSDGSSRFGREKKYGFFPSAALSWRISEENFMKGVNQISDLKLRVTYGATGNNNIGNYAHLATVSYPSYVLNGASVGGLAPNNIENALLTWEKQNSINFGLDAAFFRNRISMTAEYYISRNHQLLLNVNVPQITGFNTSLQNIGEVENKGWEFTLNTHNVSGKGGALDWKTNFNVSTFRNKVLKLGPEGAPLISGMHITRIGDPMGMFWGYKTDGHFKNQAELAAGPLYGSGTADESRVGDIRFKDIGGGPNGAPDGKITTDDRTIIGNPYPKFYYGMTNTISYQNFMLSVSISGSYKNDVLYNGDMQLYTRARYRQYSVVRNHWKSESEPGTDPRPNNLPKGGLRERSDRFMDDGTFFKVNNINLSYSFPGKITQNLRVSSLRLYVTSNNPFLFTKFKDFNPEVYNNRTDPRYPGVSDWNYPVARSFIIGFNVTF